MHARSQSLLASFRTVGEPHQLIKHTNHPPMFALTCSHLLSQTFDCQFKPAECDPQTFSPLSFFVESLVYATRLPFSVTVASLVILQRLYTRLPPAAYRRRAQYSPHRLFAGAYMFAAKQYFYMGRTLGHTHPRSPELADLLPVTDRSSAKLSNAYWANITTYDPAEIREIQKELLVALGRNIVVFPITDPRTEEHIKKMNALPMSRNLPARVRNLSRMTVEDQYEYFVNRNQKPDRTKQNPMPTVAWWKNRSISYP